jgi:alkanesulfonate monooxygenase SsuD/methylene tetrahydromethanopterin reductase-like flavin-dependent oxidoreductase (luciferase family)
MPDDELSVDYCLDNLVIAGSPKTVVEKLVEFRDHVGPFETLICSHHDWVHETLWRRHMELLATEVMPRFRCAIG